MRALYRKGFIVSPKQPVQQANATWIAHSEEYFFVSFRKMVEYEHYLSGTSRNVIVRPVWIHDC